MKEPRRLLDRKLAPLERAVLRAADDERPSARARQKTLAALGVAAATTAAATGAASASAATGAASAGVAAKSSAAGIGAASAGATAGAAAGVGAKAGAGVALTSTAIAKWVGIGIATVSLAGVTRYEIARAPRAAAPPAFVAPPTTAPTAAPRGATARGGSAKDIADPSSDLPDDVAARGVEANAEAIDSAPQATAAPPLLATPPRASDSAQRTASGASAATRRPTELAAEGDTTASDLATLDRVNALLEKGDAHGALALLDAYGYGLERGPLALEAKVLRVEALAGAGDVRGARDAATALLAANPVSPYAARLRRVLATLSEKP